MSPLISSPKSIIALLTLFSGCLNGAMAASGAADDEVQILLKPRAAASDESINTVTKAHGAWQHREIRQLRVRVLKVKRSEAATLLATLRARQDVQFAEADAMAYAFGSANDPYYASGQEWHLAKIEAPMAWDQTTGSAKVVVAVIDTGVAATHPDLAGQILSGGYDFVANDSDPTDENGHGTAVAGTIAAASNNAVGVAGVSWKTPILPVRVLDASGSGSHSAIASGIVYAADHGARILNLSLGGTAGSQTLLDAVNYAWSKGCVVVAAAGNNGNSTPCYPAAYPNVVAVAATNATDSRPTWSNFGSYVKVAAPGENICTTSKPDGYGMWSGTSFSSPVTSGVVALMASAAPVLTNASLVDLLEKNCDDVGTPGIDQDSGYGRVNARRAVVAAMSFAATDTILPTVTFSSPASGATVSGAVKVGVNSSDNVAVTRVELYVDGQLEAQSATAVSSFSWDTNGDAEGQHTLQARAYDAAGNVGIATITVNLHNATADSVMSVARIVTPVTYSRIVGSNTSIAVNSSDNVGVVKVAVYIDGRLAGTTALANPTFTWNTTGMAYGWHSLQALAYDAAGNAGGSSVVWVMK